MCPKWHTEHRNIKSGDVVLVQDSNLVRGEWRKALVVKSIISGDDRVRHVIIEYTSGNTKIKVERPVQRLIVLVPVDEQRVGSVQCHASIVETKANNTKAEADA